MKILFSRIFLPVLTATSQLQNAASRNVAEAAATKLKPFMNRRTFYTLCVCSSLTPRCLYNARLTRRVQSVLCTALLKARDLDATAHREYGHRLKLSDKLDTLDFLLSQANANADNPAASSNQTPGLSFNPHLYGAK